MILTRITVDSDLSEAAIEYAIKSLHEYKTSQVGALYVSSEGLRDGGTLARKFHLTLYLDDNLPPDAWYVKDKWFGVFSPGA